MVITRNFADMKFRMLTEEELECFEQEFKQFLIVNGVEAKEWEKMNVSNNEKAIQFVELFSDTVLQKVYGKIKYLEHRNDIFLSGFQVQQKQHRIDFYKCEKWSENRPVNTRINT